MSAKTKILFGIAAFLFTAFVFFITDLGQELLRRPYMHPGMDHFELDDVYMGAGLAPWVYLLAPAMFVAVIGGISWWVDRSRVNSIRVHPR